MGKYMGQFLTMLVLLVLFLVLPRQAYTQESEQLSQNVPASEQLSQSMQEKRDQRQRFLQLSPGERLARAMGDITVESLNGLWIFSTSSKAIINRYELTKLHEDGPILFLEGIDLDEGTPVVLFHHSAVEDIDKKNAFVLIDPDEEGCDVFFLYRTKPHSAKGEHYRSETQCQAISGQAEMLTAGRNPKSFRKPGHIKGKRPAAEKTTAQSAGTTDTDAEGQTGESN